MSCSGSIQSAAAIAAQSPTVASHSSSLSSSICSSTSSRFPASSAQTSPRVVDNSSSDQNSRLSNLNRHYERLSAAAEEIHHQVAPQQGMIDREMSSAAATTATLHAGPSHATSSSHALNVPKDSRGRPASKTRRTNSGGSRVPSEDRTNDGRSDSGSDRRHSIKDRIILSNAENGSKASTNGQSSETHLDLATFPPQDLLRVLAALLQQIAAANDQLRPQTIDAGGTTSDADSPSDESSRRRRRMNEERLAPAAATAAADPEMALVGNNTLDDKFQTTLINGKPTSAANSALQTPSSTLCFRARNVPSISIEAYLLRILRYCPASCEVFVSLLVYFDRMSKMGQKRADSDKSKLSENGVTTRTEEEISEIDDAFIGMQGFAIDSFNVHRLVIAGVTVASKFFSDVFYTNSRYAKVGGLPVHELNQLELQFLLLNDFNLMIPLEEMQRYANQLLLYGNGNAIAVENATSEASSSMATAVETNNEQLPRGRSNTQKDTNGDVSMYER